MREYVVAKLAEIDEALRILDTSPNALEQHDEREKLIRMASQLATSLAESSGEQSNLD